LHDGATQGRLAAAGFADESKDLAASDLKRHVIDSFDQLMLGSEMGAKILDA
jgi:hypothetical protein